VRRWLTCCASTAAVALIAAALLLLVGIPALVGYLAGYDRQPLFDLQGLGQRHTMGVYDVILMAVTEAGCSSGARCHPAHVTFEVVRHGGEVGSGTAYRVDLPAGEAASDLIALADGTALRVVAVRSAPSSQPNEPEPRVRFQAFLPPASEE